MRTNRSFFIVLILILLNFPLLASVSVRVQIIKPTIDNGYPVLGYVVEIKDEYATAWTRAGEVKKGDMFYTDNVLEGYIYYFRVISYNIAGLGQPTRPTQVGPLQHDIDYHIVIQSLSPGYRSIKAGKMATFDLDPLKKFVIGDQVEVPLKP